MNTQQVLLTVKGGSLAVDAEVIGQLAIHDWPYDSVFEIRVSHCKSGSFIAAFTSYQDAVDFSHKANKLIDFDALSTSLADDGVRVSKKRYAEQVKQLKELRDSYPSNIPVFQLTIGKFDRNQLKRFLSRNDNPS